MSPVVLPLEELVTLARRHPDGLRLARYRLRDLALAVHGRVDHVGGGEQLRPRDADAGEVALHLRAAVVAAAVVLVRRAHCGFLRPLRRPPPAAADGAEGAAACAGAVALGPPFRRARFSAIDAGV